MKRLFVSSWKNSWGMGDGRGIVGIFFKESV